MSIHEQHSNFWIMYNICMHTNFPSQLAMFSVTPKWTQPKMKPKPSLMSTRKNKTVPSSVILTPPSKPSPKMKRDARAEATQQIAVPHGILLIADKRLLRVYSCLTNIYTGKSQPRFDYRRLVVTPPTRLKMLLIASAKLKIQPLSGSLLKSLRARIKYLDTLW